MIENLGKRELKRLRAKWRREKLHRFYYSFFRPLAKLVFIATFFVLAFSWLVAYCAVNNIAFLWLN